MKKTLLLFGAVLVLAGCGGDKDVADEKPAIEPAENPAGYFGALKNANEKATDGINDAVNAQNQRNEEALKILEEGLSGEKTNSTNAKAMTESTIQPQITAPEGVDISLAESCTGAKIITNKGEIEVSFYGADSPVTVANFCSLAQKGFYDGVIFHRIIQNFMIQGGDPTGTGTGGPDYKFGDEFNSHKIVRGSLAMANAGPATNGSQFFIVTAPATPHLDGRHTNFGEVVSGMDVVDTIESVETDGRDKPLEDVIIRGIDLIQK